MMAQCFPVHLGVRLLAANEVSCLLAADALNRSFTMTYTNGSQAHPSSRVPQPRSAVQHAITAVLFPSVAAFPGFIRVMRAAEEVTLAGLHKRLPNVRAQMFLVLLDGQDVVRTSVDDLLSDGLLATHGVDGDQGAAYVEQFQERRYGRDFIRFLVDGHLAQRQALRRCPGANQVQRTKLGRSGAAQSLTINGHVFDTQGLL